jgi:hypothetical protein
VLFRSNNLFGIGVGDVLVGKVLEHGQDAFFADGIISHGGVAANEGGRNPKARLPRDTRTRACAQRKTGRERENVCGVVLLCCVCCVFFFFSFFRSFSSFFGTFSTWTAWPPAAAAAATAWSAAWWAPSRLQLPVRRGPALTPLCALLTLRGGGVPPGGYLAYVLKRQPPSQPFHRTLLMGFSGGDFPSAASSHGLPAALTPAMGAVVVPAFFALALARLLA